MQLPVFLIEILENHPIVLLDAGARGGIEELKRLAPWVQAYGFEPHPESFQEIPSRESPYARQSYLPLALGAEKGKRLLNLARHPSYSSFLEVDWAVHRRHLQLMPMYEQWKAAMAPVGQAEVQVSTLDAVAGELGISYISFLKLDTQGTELEILQGARELLEGGRIGLIKCEVSFIPFYKGQCLYGDVSRFLQNHGFVFADCLFYPEVENRRPEPWKRVSASAAGVVERPHFAMGGDAIFFHAAPGNEHQGVATGLLLAEMGYYSPAYEIMLNYSGLAEDETAAALQATARRPFRQKFKKAVKRWAPPVIVDWLKRR